MNNTNLEYMSLNKADMPAVIRRTNLKPTIDNLLLPVFESISNGLHSISDYKEIDNNFNGKIHIEIFTEPFTVIVSDNGLGLNYRNLEAFKTPFTGIKLRKNGKGFGRFIGFKVFDEIIYSSRHKGNKEEYETLNFQFDIFSKNELLQTEQQNKILGKTGCSVSFSNIKPDFNKIIQNIKTDQIVDRIIRYFLPYFISGKLPELIIDVDGDRHDARDRFTELFAPEKTYDETISINDVDYKFTIGISLSKKGDLFPKHSMLLFADDRIIGNGRNLERKIGTSHFLNDEGEKSVIVASVSGIFLDQNANTARTAIEASEEEIDIIANSVSKKILADREEYTKEHRTIQKNNLVVALQRNPLLRTALKGKPLDQYIEEKPMSWGAEEFVSNLALSRYRDQGRWERELEDKVKNGQALKEARQEIMEHIDEENKEALAAYVTHRKTVIDLADKIIEIQDDGATSLEEVFHDLVYSRYQDSDNTKFYQHNLWLLDERLSFVSYISSDRTIRGGKRQKGDKVADLILFEDCSVYSNSDSNSLILVEFKRPRKANYKYGDVKQDPIQQVFETVSKIREEKSLVSTSGKRIQVPEGTRIFAYIIADLEPKLVKVIQDHDFNQTWDHLGYYRYHENRDTFVEVFGYDKLISDAKKRNSAFFDVLLGDLV